MEALPPVENPWSMGSSAFPFIREHIKKCNRNNILASVAILIIVPLAVIFGGGPFLRTAMDVRLFILALMAVVGLPIYAIWNMIRSLNWQSNPQAHPALQWSDIGAPFQVADHIDREISQKDAHIRIGPALFTPSWLLRYSNWGMESMLLSQVAWAYKKVTTHKTYGVTTNKTYSLQVWSQSGKKMEVQSIPEKHVDEILRLMHDRTPWAIFGYSPEINTAWTKNRSQVIQAVSVRKQEIESGITSLVGQAQ